MKKQFIKVCPQCGSTDIGLPMGGLDGGMPIRDHCRKCDNEGIFPETEDSEIKSFKKNLKNAKHN